MYTLVKLFTIKTRNMGQNIKAWENAEDPGQTASLRVGTLATISARLWLQRFYHNTHN